jgi:LCP family protein required for cell wall assembly
MGAESLWEPHTPVRSGPPTLPPLTPPTSPPPPSGERRSKRYGRPTAVAGLALVLLVLAGLIIMYVASERLGNNVTRVQAFDGLDEASRPPATAALTFLLVGTDSRSEVTPPGVTADGAGSDADVVMVARFAPDMKSATVVSIPRDSLVDIPDRGRGRVANAYATGGPSLLIRTVEKLTDLRVDHFAVIDFAGFRSMVDTLGGIEVDPAGSSNPAHLDGGQALLYVRDRTGVERGERARRQQNALRAILDKAASSNTLSDPVRLYDFLDAASRSVGVDDTLSNGGIRALALKLSDLQPTDVLFLRAPVAGVSRDAGGIVMLLDPGRAPQLWAAVQQGTAASYVQQNGRDSLGPLTR